MLSPDARSVAVSLLRPPASYRLDLAVVTTYSLDLEALLALPLAVLAHADDGLEALLVDPLLLMEGLRTAGERLHVFVDEGGIAIPRANRPLYALLEPCVHPTQAPNGGAFHPKVWVARFTGEGEPIIRVAVLTRNLTFDRSWDLALVSEGSPGRLQYRPSNPVGKLIGQLAGMAVETPNAAVQEALKQLASEVARTHFAAPQGFDGDVEFTVLGLKRSAPIWMPHSQPLRGLAIAPFANKTALDRVANTPHSHFTLVSRQDTLDALPEDTLARWSDVYVLADPLEDEADDQTRPTGLHAKLIGIEHGHQVTWWTGSANLTAAAFKGRNVELMAAVTGKKGCIEGKTGQGIQHFIDAGFLKLCVEYKPQIVEPEAAAVRAARKALDRTGKMLVSSDLTVRCAPGKVDWSWTLAGAIDLPEGVELRVWPATLPEAQARPFANPIEWVLPATYTTAFVAFHAYIPDSGVPAVRLLRKLPAEGLPDDRVSQVIRLLIDDQDKLLRFLRALLGGLDGLTQWTQDAGRGSAGPWSSGLGGETLLEDLVRAASRDPARLEPIGRLLTDLRSTQEGRAIIPEGLLDLWDVVEATLKSDVEDHDD